MNGITRLNLNDVVAAGPPYRQHARAAYALVRDKDAEIVRLESLIAVLGPQGVQLLESARERGFTGREAALYIGGRLEGDCG